MATLAAKTALAVLGAIEDTMEIAGSLQGVVGGIQKNRSNKVHSWVRIGRAIASANRYPSVIIYSYH